MDCSFLDAYTCVLLSNGIRQFGVSNRNFRDADLHRRAVTQFGEDRIAELELYLRTAAEQIFDVEGAEVHPNLEPLNQE